MKKLLEAVTKFAGEPEQKPGDQVRGTEKATNKKSSEHPFKGRLVGGGCEESAKPNMLKGLQKVSENKSLEWELAEAFANFNEDDLGVEPKRPHRPGTRAEKVGTRGHKEQPRYKTVKEEGNDNTYMGTVKNKQSGLEFKVYAAHPANREGERVSNLIYLVDPKTGKKVHKFTSSKEIEQYYDWTRFPGKFSEGWGHGTDRVRLPDEPANYYHGTGQLSKEYNELYAKLVPDSGTADTIEGEVLRAASKIVYRHYNDGDDFNQASYSQLEPYIGRVTSYDDLAHKATEFALKAQGNYHPNAGWDCLDVMEYGPEDDDYDDEDDYYDEENPDNWDDEEDVDEGWESGPEERSSYEPDPDLGYDQARQEKADASAQAQQAKRPQTKVYTLTGRGPNMEPNYKFPGEYSSQAEADAARTKLMANPKTPNPRMISISTHTKFLDEEGHTYTGPHGEMDVEKKGNVTTVRRKGWDSSHGSTTKVKGGKYFSNPNDKVPGPGIKTGSGISDTAGSSRKIPQYDLDYTDRDMDEGMSSYPTDANWDKSGQMDPLTGGTGPSRTRKDPRSTKHDLDVANWQTKKAIKDRKAKGVHKKVHIPEGIESADPVEGAVLKAVQELIHQGHTEVAPEVITNMVVAATSQPFMLKDLVDANKNSSAIQHYIDSINPSKVKFSSDILTVKNENPAKAQAQSKERAQAGVSSMAARAANRSRLGESKTVPVISAFRRGMEKIAASGMNPQDKQAAFDRLSAEFHKNASAYSNAMKAKKSKMDEAGANQPSGTAAPGAGSNPNNPQAQQAALQATNALKSATNTPTAAPQLAKAIDDASQGTATNAMDMKALAPTMNVVKAASQDPKIANQFKTLAQQAKNSQQQQQKPQQQ